jgi:CubicO group peptidase (beta-lactamase class C family)
MSVRFRLGLVLGMLCLVAATGRAVATTPRISPLQEARLARIFEPWNRLDSPGAAVAVVMDGQVVFAHGYGAANLDDATPMTSRSVFYTASMSKQFTATAIAILALEGKLSLDDDVRRWIPSLPAYARPITIRHLVHHTSGLRDYFSLWDMAGRSIEDYFDNDAVIRLLSKQKALVFDPGQEFLYSNSGYVVLADIVKRASGKSLGTFAADRIFGPLGMRDTHFNEDLHAIVPHRVVSYEPGADGVLRLYVKNFDASGDGNMLSSVDDFARWAKVLEGDSLGVKGLRDLIVTPGTLASGAKQDYAFGLRHGTYRGLANISHGGSLLGFRGMIQYFPDRRCTIVCLSNAGTINAGALARRVAGVVLFDLDGSEPPPPPPTSTQVSAAELDRMVGVYENVATPGDFVRILRPEGRLVVHLPAAPATLSLLSAGVFASAAAGVTLITDQFAANRTITVIAQARSRRTYRQTTVAAWPDTVVRAREGTYWSDELGVAFVVEADGAGLRLRRGNQDSWPLEVLNTESALAGKLQMTFTTGTAASPAGFVVKSGRITNIRFDRLPASHSAR